MYIREIYFKRYNIYKKSLHSKWQQNEHLFYKCIYDKDMLIMIFEKKV